MKTLKQKPYQKPALPERDVFFGLRVNRELAKALDSFAVERQISRSHAVRYLLTEALKRHGNKS